MILFLFERAIQFLFASYLAAPVIDTFVEDPSPDGSIGPVATLQLTNKDVRFDDFPRSASLINGVFPAPVITAKKGEKFELTVENMLTDNTMHRSTSIHWHGVTQRGTAHMDGPVGVTQCPISPGKSFVYKFTATDAGTFWYHSHYATQYCDGIRGALIVYDPNDPYKANGTYHVDDASTVLTLADWYHFPSPSLGHFPSPDSTLINGKGRYPGKATADLFVLTVERGKRYRLRVVSIACDPDFMFSIDDHKLTVMEADGELVVPVHGIDIVPIFPGQRYSLILDANQAGDNYWIRAQPSAGNNGLPGTFFNGVNSAILRYVNATAVFPKSEHKDDGTVLREFELHALIDPTPPGKPTIDGADFQYNFKFHYNNNTETFSLNGRPFVPNLTVPILLQILNNVSAADTVLPPSSIFKIPRNKSVSISMPGGVFDGPHPFHLHGHSFSVVRTADSDKYNFTNPEDNYNFINPVRRDTTSFGEKEDSNVMIRFKTDNPGPWIFHCHIDWHLERGMALVFIEDEEGIKAGGPPPREWHQLCQDFSQLPSNMTEIVTVPRYLPTPV